jgi:hypothetical protein
MQVLAILQKMGRAYRKKMRIIHGGLDLAIWLPVYTFGKKMYRIPLA